MMNRTKNISSYHIISWSYHDQPSLFQVPIPIPMIHFVPLWGTGCGIKEIKGNKIWTPQCLVDQQLGSRKLSFDHGHKDTGTTEGWIRFHTLNMRGVWQSATGVSFLASHNWLFHTTLSSWWRQTQVAQPVGNVIFNGHAVLMLPPKGDTHGYPTTVQSTGLNSTPGGFHDDPSLKAQEFTA